MLVGRGKGRKGRTLLLLEEMGKEKLESEKRGEERRGRERERQDLPSYTLNQLNPAQFCYQRRSTFFPFPEWNNEGNTCPFGKPLNILF